MSISYLIDVLRYNLRNMSLPFLGSFGNLISYLLGEIKSFAPCSDIRNGRITQNRTAMAASRALNKGMSPKISIPCEAFPIADNLRALNIVNSSNVVLPRGQSEGVAWAALD